MRPPCFRIRTLMIAIGLVALVLSIGLWVNGHPHAKWAEAANTLCVIVLLADGFLGPLFRVPPDPREP